MRMKKWITIKKKKACITWKGSKTVGWNRLVSKEAGQKRRFYCKTSQSLFVIHQKVAMAAPQAMPEVSEKRSSCSFIFGKSHLHLMWLKSVPSFFLDYFGSPLASGSAFKAQTAKPKINLHQIHIFPACLPLGIIYIQNWFHFICVLSVWNISMATDSLKNWKEKRESIILEWHKHNLTL